MDFCLGKYRELLECLIEKGYTFQSVGDFIENKKHKTILLRHDIDLRPKNALNMAKLEKELGVNGVYYFRMRQRLYNLNIINEICKLGNEIGYHYETVDKVMNVKGYKVIIGWMVKMLKSYKVTKLQSDKVTKLQSDGVTNLQGDKVTELQSDKVIKLQSDKVTKLQSDKVTKLQSDKVTKLQSDGVTKLQGDKVTELQSDKVIKLQSDKDTELQGDKEMDGVIDRAYELFCEELEIFRKDFDVKTVCMHGSPWSGVDNKLIWTKYNYKDLGIVLEPYYDIDWNEVGYLTDTGRRWNGFWSNLRDRVKPKLHFNFQTTDDIIKHADKLNDRLVITVHPQRWNSCCIPWLKELIWQNVKNVVKKYVVMRVVKL